MSSNALVSLVALAGWLVLVAAAFRARRVSARRTLTLGLTWLAIFIGIALLISLILG